MTGEVIYRDPGEAPDVDWIDKSMVDVDPAYQRPLDEARVVRIVEFFDWSSFGALVLARKDDGRFNCTDGQHRLEAAKRHPGVSLLPAVIIKPKGTQAEAENFVSINAHRKNVTPLDLYWAELAAGDGDAVNIATIVEQAGVTIQRHAGSGGPPSATVAIGAVRALLARQGDRKSREILHALAEAKLTPITSTQIRAAEMLMTDPEFRDDVEPIAITEAIAGRAQSIEDEARAFATTHRMPVIKAFASVWFKRCRKKRKAA